MVLYIKMTNAGLNTGPFNIYSDACVPAYSCAFETGISKAVLQAGFTSYAAPPGTTNVRIQSMDQICTPQTSKIEPVTGPLYATNATTLESITSILPAFFSTPFPINPGVTWIVNHNAFPFPGADIDVSVSSTVESGCVRLFINDVQVDCKNAPATGPQTVTFLGVVATEFDKIEIVYEAGTTC